MDFGAKADGTLGSGVPMIARKLVAAVFTLALLAPFAQARKSTNMKVHRIAKPVKHPKHKKRPAVPKYGARR